MSCAPRLAYFLRTFPVRSETFIHNELRQLGADGPMPLVRSMFRPGPGAACEEPPHGVAEAHYLVDIDKGLLPALTADNVRALMAAPLRYAAQMAASGLAVSFAERIKLAHFAQDFLRAGVEHIHTHFLFEHIDPIRYVSRLTGIPYSMTLHAADIYVEGQKVREKIDEAAFAITISEYNRDYLIREAGAPAHKVHVVHCGIDLDTFTFAPPPANPVPVICSVGRLVQKKGFDVLLKALARVRDAGREFEFRLVGDGEERTALQALAASLGLGERVRFLGALEADRTREEIARADVFALACKVAENGDRDGIPVVLMEAMALGRPVVSTRLSGIPELVTDGCGLLAEPGDDAQVAEHLLSLLRDANLKENSIRRAREHVEREFSLEGQVRGLTDLVCRAKADGKEAVACAS